jgi:Tfp pilus assembly protein PilF
MPEGIAVGAPLVVSGSMHQIVQQLPAMARALAVRLGSAKPTIAATINATPQEMTLLGQVPWKAQTAVSSTQAKQLETVSQRVPLAALLLLRSGTLMNGSTLARTTVSRLLKFAPYNAIAVADVAWKMTGALKPYSALLQRNRKRYPNNYLLSVAEVCRQRALENRVAERKAAEHAVRCAPQNAFAWTELGESISNQAQDMRRSRYIAQLSTRELAYLKMLYPQYVSASLHAVQLDPNSSYVWLAASKACAFNGQSELADVAFWRAFSLNRRQKDILWWGLQLYQPKWSDDSTNLRLLTDLVSSDYELFSTMYDDVVYALSNSGFESQAQAKLMEAVAMFENVVRRDPKNAMAHLRWAELAKNHGHDGSKDDIAVREYRAYVALRPDDANAIYQLGWMLHYKKRKYNEAEKFYRRALALAPEFGDATNALGDITYYVHRNAKGAEALYRKAISINDDGLYHAELARLLLDTNRRSEAIMHTNRAIALGYTDTCNPIFERLGIDPRPKSSARGDTLKDIMKAFTS